MDERTVRRYVDHLIDLDIPFVIEYPGALRGHVHALARRLSASAGDVPGTAGQPPPD